MSENEKKNCSTCERIRELKEQGEYYKDARQSKYKTVSVCKFSLVVEDYFDIGGELEYGGRASYNTKPISFCPECGRKFEEDELIW